MNDNMNDFQKKMWESELENKLHSQKGEFHLSFAFNIINSEEFYDDLISTVLMHFDKALEINSAYSSVVNTGKGIMYNKIQQYDKALPFLDKAIELDPNDDSAYIERAFANSNLGNHDKVIQDYLKGLSLNPRNHPGYFNLAKAFYDINKYDLAIENLNIAADINPDFPYQYYLRAISYNALGKNFEAMSDYKKFLEFKDLITDKDLILKTEEKILALE